MEFILLEAITGEKVAIRITEITSISDNEKKKRVEVVTKTGTWNISPKYSVAAIVKSIEENHLTI